MPEAEISWLMPTGHLPAPGRAVPRATYRLQIQPSFDLAAAADAVDYLARLGVSHLQLSPLLEAVPGSTHGYDVVDHSRIRAELGGEKGLRALAERARAAGLGLVLDIVPNHMAFPEDCRLNPRLWETLREGPDAPSARWFDIEWSALPGPVDRPADGRVLLPVLGRRIHQELDALRVEHRPEGGGEPVLRYHERVLPLRPGTADLPLPELLDHQWYRPAWWRLDSSELNYRRFFTVDSLIGLRVEDPAVFEATHQVPLRLLDEGVLDGLRVDHPDGLVDPRGYLRRLHERCGGRWTVVEKILSDDEHLSADWPCSGTTGYDALRHIDGLFLDEMGLETLARAYQRETGQRVVPDDRGTLVGRGFAETARRSKRQIVEEDLTSEVGRLVRLARRLGERAPVLRDHSRLALRRAIDELLAAYPTYRPYTTPDLPYGDSRKRLDEAALRARLGFGGGPEEDAVDVVRDLVLGDLDLGKPGEAGGSGEEFAARFAQTATAAAAKGIEDTAGYRWTPLSSLNEVGCAPEWPCVPPSEFHAYCRHLRRNWPATMTTLTTHDTKRSADVRARLAVLAEMPEEWAEARRDWTAAAARYRTGPFPDSHALQLLWQTLVGAWPIEPRRLVDHLVKAVREARLSSSWKEPSEEYERAVTRHATAVLADAELRASLDRFVAGITPHARVNSLSAALLQLTMPGVPDIYQGGESELLRLVDPDNRSPVDLAALDRLLGELLDGRRPDGLAEEKLLLTAAALRVRRERAESFGAHGVHRPLHARGPAFLHVVAFARADDVVTVVTRLPHRLRRQGGWGDTALTLPAGDWRCELTGLGFSGGRVPLADLLTQWPVTLLRRV